MNVRTRFAPSPTGYLHIGGVRTSLFNWLYARRHGGQFVLRIDDTDAERNRPEALQPILDGFRWLGITWDEGPEIGGPYGPYFQAQRQQLYLDAAMRLLDAGHAYPCYATKEELDSARKAAEETKSSFVYRGAHRTTPPAEGRRLYEAQRTVLRLKVPAGRTVGIDDKIAGRVEVQSDTIGDPVILRADGRALYNFATVVDDAAMRITHIIRAKEHLSNTPVQVLIYEALGYPVPTLAHVPVVNAPNSSKKLSKRDMQKFMTPDVLTLLRAVHAVPADWSDEQIKKNENLNPATVAYYRALGYLPEALVNYFGRLGWSLDGTSEIIALETMIANFDFARVNDSSASFDPEKLHWVAGEYMKMSPVARRVEGVVPVLQRAGLLSSSPDETALARVRQVVEACGDRLAIFSDVLHYGAFFFREPSYDPLAVKKRLQKEGAADLLRTLRQLLEQAEPFAVQALEVKIREFCEAHAIKLGDVNHVLRVATTGVGIGPGLFDCLAILGKAESLRRIDMALQLPGVRKE
jgi:nondiscriminating glutamyl-tRNA synthetase